MAAKISAFLALLAGFVFWKLIGGTVGFLVGCLVSVVASALFIGLFNAISAIVLRGKGSLPAAAKESAPTDAAPDDKK